MKKALIIVDPQNDFVDPKGSLFVPKSLEAIKAICRYIMINGSSLDDIIVSLDSHHPWHVSNSMFWKESPKEFTTITPELVGNGTFTLASSSDTLRSSVLSCMEILGPITIWPEHCIIGTWGHCIPESLSEVLRTWETIHKKQVIYKDKGSHEEYEAYSLFTDVEIKNKLMGLQVTEKWMPLTENCDEVIISGFAKDICVGETVKAMRKREEYRGKLRFLEAGLASINSANCEIYQDCINNFEAENI